MAEQSEFAWSRVGEDPEPFVRKVMVNTYASWWRRKWRGETPTEELPDRAGPDRTGLVDERDELWQALGRLRLDDTLIAAHPVLNRDRSRPPPAPRCVTCSTSAPPRCLSGPAVGRRSPVG